MNELKRTMTANNGDIPRLYKSRDMAEKWGISYNALREMVLSGKIRPIVGIGKSWLFDGSELKPVLERL